MNCIKKNGLILSQGNKYWYKDDCFHRDDGPAIEWPDGSKFWYKDGIVHREDGPAVECENGNKLWYKTGMLYRLNKHEIYNDKCNNCNLMIIDNFHYIYINELYSLLDKFAPTCAEINMMQALL